MADVSLSAILQCWRELDLEGMRSKLDGVGLTIAQHQEDSIQKRRGLADATRDFKKAANEGAIKLVGPLLKQYQEEIDRLTKRAKHGESAFLELYQKLYEAPDPAPALSAALQTASRAADLEVQCRKLGAELGEYKEESRQIKNQDFTIRKLEERIRELEGELEAREEEAVAARQEAVAQADAARLAQMEEREAELTAMLAQAQASLGALQRLHGSAQNQLFAMQSASEEQRAGREAELELATSELERAQERLRAMEREKEDLVARLGGGGGGGSGGGGGGGSKVLQQQQGRSGQRGSGSGEGGGEGGGSSWQAGYGGSAVEEALRQELLTQRQLCARLRSEVAALRQEASVAGEGWQAKLEAQREALAAQEQAQLADRPTVAQAEELRQQLRILQAMVGVGDSVDLEGAAGDGGGGGSALPGAGKAGGGAAGSEGGAGAGGGPGGLGSLEAVLSAKNRRLEHELTMLKLKVVDAQVEAEAQQARAAELEGALQGAQQLVAKLEEDLLVGRDVATTVGGSAGGAGVLISGGSGGNGGSGAGASSDRRLSGILGVAFSAAADEQGGAAGGGGGEGGGGGSDASVVKIVCAQRDRLKAKVTDLEEEVGRLKGQLRAAQEEAAAARADNVALVERLRYVGGYGKQQQQRGSHGGDADAAAGADVENRYSKAYEERLNPFQEFQGHQAEKRRRALHFADKAMYAFGQLVFGSQASRVAMFVYLLALHGLVGLVLLRMTHHSSSQLIDHTQAVLDHGRHGATLVMHHGHHFRRVVDAPTGTS